LDAGDEEAGFEGFFDGDLVGLAGGLEGEPLGGQGVFVLDLDGLGLAAAELMIGGREAGGSGLEAGEDQDQGVLQGIGPGGIGARELAEAFGLLLAVGGLTPEMLDHPASGIGLAQLPEGGWSARRTLQCDALQGAGRTGGLVDGWSRGGGENGHGDEERMGMRRTGAAKAAQAARGSGENGDGTSITSTGTGEREEQRRACCTSEAVPGPPGKAITSTEAVNAWEVRAWASARACSRRRRLRIGPALRP